MQVSVKVDILDAVSKLKDFQVRQLPYATSRAINDTALSARTALLNRATSGLFKFRTNPAWIRNATTGWFNTTFSNKNQTPIVAYVNAIRDYLFLHEYSGTRTKRGGGMLAVPLGDLARKRIPPEMRPRYLLGGNYQSLLNMAASTKYGPRRHAQALATYGKGFIMKTNGHTLIVQRTGPRQLKFLYVLVPSVYIQKRLQMYETVRATAQREFATFFRQRMIEAMR